MYRKNYTRLFAALLLLLGISFSQRSEAQITGIDGTYAYSWASSYCSVPSEVHLYIFGNVTGTLTEEDSITVSFFYGDGSDTTFNVPAGMAGGGMVDSFYASMTHTYALAGTYTPMITLMTATGITDTAYASTFELTNTCANISGHLYVDADGDCNYDAGETLIPGLFVTATNTTTGITYYSTYSYTGNYNMEVPTGTYTINTGTWWTGMAPTCPTGGTATLTVAGSGTYTQNFGFNCGSSTDPDLSVVAGATGFRPGFVRSLYVYGFSNEFCNEVPATISLTLPALTSYAGIGWGPTPTVSGSTLTWNVTDLGGISSFMASIGVYTDESAVIGDSACLTVTITPVGATDPDMANNSYDICVPFNNSFDPNEKLVAPKGTGDLGFIPVGTELLTYQINFQNTGNDTAYNVTIKDLLDADIDPGSVHIIGGSHPFTSSIVNGHELNVRFSNIMLPDSNINEPASHGYVIYQARLKPSIASDATINNTAQIYFDYNDAIITNTTVNTLFTPTSVQQLQNGNLNATVFPNPASNALTVKVAGNRAFTATLTDITGRVVMSRNGQDAVQLSTRSLPNGIYHLNIQSGAQNMHTKVVVAH